MPDPSVCFTEIESVPRDEDGPVFAEPWQAQAFAIAVRLSAQGHFTWKEWAAALAAELAAAAVTSTLEFKVKGDTIEPSETLIGHDVRFLRSENDAIPQRNPTYQAGDTLWVRFDITGYKFGEKNKYDVEYGLAILRANGETMFTQPVAAKETSESFYPQHYVPGLLSLGLNNDLPKGSYTLVITMRDKIGNQTWESREKFQVQ
jgi:hypothetical protein